MNIPISPLVVITKLVENEPGRCRKSPDFKKLLRKEKSTMKSQMVGRDFLTLMDFSKEEVEYFLDTAAELKRKRRMGEPHEYLKGKTVAMIF
ncbi:MAG: hypothetical protein V3V88_03230, partial [Dehalococcoidia bacterium]